MRVSLPSQPELGLMLNMMPGGRRDEGLLARVAQSDADASPDEMLRVTKLRSGTRSINGVAGEEALERVREFNLATTYGFLWKSEGVADDPYQPFLSPELRSGRNPSSGGRPLDSSLHGDAVLALWDTISSTICLRQPADRAA